jgi:thiol-disulfide isomerase/thioredoxin
MRNIPVIKKINLFLVLTIVLIFTTGITDFCYAESNTPDKKITKKGKKLPKFSLKSAITGKTVRANDFEGKILLINFFATWCPPCRMEIPSLIELQRHYKPKGFSVIGMSVDQGGPRIVKRMGKRMGVNYPFLMANSKLTRDFGGVVGIPVSFLVDRQGYVVKSYNGYIEHEVFVNDIERILK